MSLSRSSTMQSTKYVTSPGPYAVATGFHSRFDPGPHSLLCARPEPHRIFRIAAWRRPRRLGVGDLEARPLRFEEQRVPRSDEPEPHGACVRMARPADAPCGDGPGQAAFELERRGREVLDPVLVMLREEVVARGRVDASDVAPGKPSHQSDRVHAGREELTLRVDEREPCGRVTLATPNLRRGAGRPLREEQVAMDADEVTEAPVRQRRSRSTRPVGVDHAEHLAPHAACFHRF